MLCSTPMMAQWHACKQEAGDALLLFRLGDFYEAFHKDAHVISQAIGLTLTARQGVPMCGLPCHAADSYIDRLLSKGFKIAIAEQEEAPPKSKGLVKRDIVRIVSPGTLIQSQLLSDKRPNFFAVLSQIGSIYGLALLDVTTTELRAAEFETESALIDELCRVSPSELLLSQKFHSQHTHALQELSYRAPYLLNTKDDSYFQLEPATRALSPPLLEALSGHCASTLAVGMLLHYVREERKISLPPLVLTPTHQENPFLAIDRATLRHLELIEPLSDHAEQHTLLKRLDRTVTSMGGRLLRDWIQHPLTSLEDITERQDAVALFLTHPKESQHLKKLLEPVRDLERLVVRLSIGSKAPRDLLALGLSLAQIAPIASTSLIQVDCSHLEDLTTLSHKICTSLVEAPPVKMGDDELFRSGVHPELDRLRSLAKESLQWMARYQVTLREETGIKTLKVGFTRAFGYYIEVSAGQKEKVPSSFQRRQILAHAERFTTDILKQFEYQVLSAEERSHALELELFDTLRKEALQYKEAICLVSKNIARIDVLRALAEAAQEEQWVRPTLDRSKDMHIVEGRHPILEKILGRAHFIANDTSLTPPTSQLMLITGPNMAGKSTYLRQVALLVILAHIGSFIPAKSARIGLIDKIFSRIGASDDLARGHSTFMVEMRETAHILKEATSRSLVLLDEIGRGTSTYDGIAIAWAIAEFLLTTPGQRAKTLFATHYWELTQLEKLIDGAVNYQVAIQETESGAVFLRKIIPGGTQKSYGIHVAKLAGLPAKAIQRAEEVLLHLEESDRSETRPDKGKRARKNEAQLPLFG